MKRSDFTVTRLQEMSLTLDEAYAIMLELKGKKPPMPKKGKRSGIPETPEAYRAYAKQLEDFDKALADWKDDSDIYQSERAKLVDVYNDYASTHTSLDNVPVKYRERVWRYAWKTGRGGGIEQVKIILSDLVKIFK